MIKKNIINKEKINIIRIGSKHYDSNSNTLIILIYISLIGELSNDNFLYAYFDEKGQLKETFNRNFHLDEANKNKIQKFASENNIQEIFSKEKESYLKSIEKQKKITIEIEQIDKEIIELKKKNSKEVINKEIAKNNLIQKLIESDYNYF